MKEKNLISVQLTQEAADVLAWFTKHEFYAGTISEVVLAHFREWCCREFHEEMSKEEFRQQVSGSYEDYLRKLLGL